MKLETHRALLHRVMNLRIMTFAVCAFVAVIFVAGTFNDPNFWLTADQRGDLLFRKNKFAEAAKIYLSPARKGIAEYRNGDFEAAAKTFAKVPGATGAFNQGNAWLMHGQYDSAIKSYEQALNFQPNWKNAEENKALAIARRDKMIIDDKDRQQEQADAYTPDKIEVDQKGGDKNKVVPDMAAEKMSDDDFRASWLRRIQTTPADFLKAKFSYQAAKEDAP